MADVARNPDLEWLDHVQPVGLVLAPSLVDELGLTPTRQTQVDTALVEELLGGKGGVEDLSRPVLTDPWAFVAGALGWEAPHVAGAPGGPPIAEELRIRLPEHETTLAPTWAVKDLGQDAVASGKPWQLLVRVEAAGLDPDARGALDGWEATAHQRFERLLRETGVPAGVLITERNAEKDGEPRYLPELRLVYAPRGETSGWLSFPVRALATVAGRSMLGGLRLLLDSNAVWTDAPERRLPALLHRSRLAQAKVSTDLARQVLGALHDLMRGLDAAALQDKAAPGLIRDLAGAKPAHLYEGLLTVLMRLVFILYAEDRGLLPSRTDAAARKLYEQGYSLRGLYGRLTEDAALHQDTMDERRGAWGQLLALFRLIHAGHRSNFVQARGGKLFDPDQFPFLEGRAGKDQPPRVLPVSDGAVLRILEGLMTLETRRGRERLSYRNLDVEEIGSVYESAMGFRAQLAEGRSLALKVKASGKSKAFTPVFADLDRLLAAKPDQRLKHLKEDYGYDEKNAKRDAAVRAAKSVEELSAALEAAVDVRGSPGKELTPPGAPILQPTDERRRTGSHYTPRELTEPIVRHALQPAFERLGENPTPEQILDLKVCDPAMGSGAFLVEACRALSAQLVTAWEKHPDKKPRNIPPDEDEELFAKRLVARRCLYGVDKNPRAVELAKLSLWLATLARDHEFTFLDDALKGADSLAGLDSAPNLDVGSGEVGLSLSQILSITWDSSGPSLPMIRIISQQRFEELQQIRSAIRRAEENKKLAELEKLNDEYMEATRKLRDIGDSILGAFFIGKTIREREALRRRVEGWALASGEAGAKELQEFATKFRLAMPHLFPFHWELEFPEVFARENPGFDTIIGNPPFAGKNTILRSTRPGYLEWLSHIHPGSHGNADLAAHFFRRSFALLRREGTFGLVATNTIAQGDTRETGLAAILSEGGSIARATRRLPWPGEAAVVVSIVHVRKGVVPSAVLDGRPARRISAYLMEGDLDGVPSKLLANARRAFQGSIVLGMGFTFDDAAATKGEAESLDTMRGLISKNARNAERIFPYIGGDEVNTSPTHTHHRYVIDFGQLSEAQAREGWPALTSIVETRVKPARMTDKREAYRRYWWRFAERRNGLYAAIGDHATVIVQARVSPHLAMARLPAKMVFSEQLIVLAFSNFAPFSTLQSRAHEVWVRFFASTLEDRLRYTPSDCFETFPFPERFDSHPALEAAGRAYHDHRAALMVERSEGMTKTYNRFHDRAETAADTLRLRELHAEMDRAVLSAYGWDDLAANAKPEFLDEDNEDDHAYQDRYFWRSDFRDEVLARLLALNAERAAAEKAGGIAPEAASEGDEGEDVEAAE